MPPKLPIVIVYNILDYLSYYRWYERPTLYRTLFQLTNEEFDAIRRKIYNQRIKIIQHDNQQIYYLEGLEHCETGPALRSKNLSVYYNAGLLDRDENRGPAVIYKDSYCYYSYGELYRTNGPSFHLKGIDSLLYKILIQYFKVPYYSYIIDTLIFEYKFNKTMCKSEYINIYFKKDDDTKLNFRILVECSGQFYQKLINRCSPNNTCYVITMR